MSRLYRGVHGRHPGIALARRGEVVPANPAGNVTPEDHNAGVYLEDSPFTSWTYDRQYAAYLARRGGGEGVLLSVVEGDPGPTETWSWVASPDTSNEDEVLLKGIRIGVEVEPQ